MSNDLKQIQETLTKQIFSDYNAYCSAFGHSQSLLNVTLMFLNMPLKVMSRNHSNRCLSQQDALVHVCDQTHTH